METKTNCPTCGTPCEIGGEGETHYYIPSLQQENERLKEALKNLVDAPVGMPIFFDARNKAKSLLTPKP